MSSDIQNGAKLAEMLDDTSARRQDGPEGKEDEEEDGEYGQPSASNVTGAEDEASSDEEGDSGDEGDGDAAEGIDDDELVALRKEAEEGGESANASGATLGRGKRRRAKEDVGKEDAKRVPSVGKTAADEAAWASFQAGTDHDASSSSSRPSAAASTDAAGQPLIKVIDRIRFAGEETTRERLLPADHPDTVAFLKKQKQAPTSSGGMVSPQPLSTPSASSPSAPQPQPASSSSSSSRPPAPAPRKKRTSKLAALASAAGDGDAKKMNTLEKSKMDWEGWKGAGSGGAPSGTVASGKALSEREREEMESQTKEGGGAKGGSMAGYLGRRDFLERVKDRTNG